MLIHHKGIVIERTEDAPFMGALICAPSCGFNCKGCFNRHMKKSPIIEQDSKDIIYGIKYNPLHQGIILSGLEWSENPIEMLELAKEADTNGLQVMIYTGYPNLAEFQAVVGKRCASHVGMDGTVTKQMLAENDGTFYSMIGSMILDYYIKETYYVKCGKYDKELLVDDKVQFGVKLASSNQRIYKIEKAK